MILDKHDTSRLLIHTRRETGHSGEQKSRKRRKTNAGDGTTKAELSHPSRLVPYVTSFTFQRAHPAANPKFFV